MRYNSIDCVFLKEVLEGCDHERTTRKADSIDEIQKQWKSACPELNSWPMAIIGRISRLERRIDERMRAACAEFGIERWGFDVLASLRRAGSPFVLTPTQL